MGSGTDIAMSAGNVILIKSNLNHVISLLKIAEYSLKKIKQNLAMSFVYNAPHYSNLCNTRSATAVYSIEGACIASSVMTPVVTSRRKKVTEYLTMSLDFP